MRGMMIPDNRGRYGQRRGRQGPRNVAGRSNAAAGQPAAPTQQPPPMVAGQFGVMSQQGTYAPVSTITAFGGSLRPPTPTFTNTATPETFFPSTQPYSQPGSAQPAATSYLERAQQNRASVYQSPYGPVQPPSQPTFLPLPPPPPQGVSRSPTTQPNAMLPAFQPTVSGYGRGSDPSRWTTAGQQGPPRGSGFGALPRRTL